MDSFCCWKQCCGNCSWPPRSCAHDTMLPLPKHFQASSCLQAFAFRNSDSDCSFIQLLSRVCVVGILQECKSQRYHSSSERRAGDETHLVAIDQKFIKIVTVLQLRAAAQWCCQGGGTSLLVFRTLCEPAPPCWWPPRYLLRLMTALLQPPTPAAGCGSGLLPLPLILPSSLNILHNTFCSLFYPATTLWKGLFETSRKTL